jgi:ketosteroid isomerase-like protein
MAFIFDTLGQIQRATAMTDSIEVLLQFERVINAGNAEGICALMTGDGEFIDSLGNRIQGTEKLRAACETKILLRLGCISALATIVGKNHTNSMGS